MDGIGEDGWYKGPKRGEEDGGRPSWGDHYPPGKLLNPLGGWITRYRVLIENRRW